MKITTILLTFSLLTGASIANSQNENQLVAPQQEQEDISDQELQKFANAYTEVQVEGEKMQEEAVKTIEKEGMDVERYNQLANAQNNPEGEEDLDTEEAKKMNTINNKITKLQTDFQSKIVKVIEDKGLTVERYQTIIQQIQQDQNLQQRFGQLING